jgi:hypothetical protein
VLFVGDDCAVVFLEKDLSSGGRVLLEIGKVCVKYAEVVVSGITLADSIGVVLVLVYGHGFVLIFDPVYRSRF